MSYFVARIPSFLALALALAAAIAAPPSAARAAIVFSDDFSSPAGPLAGTTPDVGGVWTPTASALTPIQVDGAAALVKTSGQDEYSAFTAPVPNTGLGLITTSLNLTVTAAQANGDYFAHLSDPVGTTSVFVQRLFARSTTGGFQLGLVDTSGTGSTITYGAGVLALNTPLNVDVLWTLVPGSNNDTFVVNVGGLPYLTHTWTSMTAEPPALSAANLRQGSAGNAPTVTVNSYAVDANVIPEPASWALAALALACSSIIARKR